MENTYHGATISRLRQAALLLILELVFAKTALLSRHRRNASVDVTSLIEEGEQISLKWNNVISSIDALTEVSIGQCPYADFCYSNKTSEPLYGNEESCCKSCSCSELCGHQMSCCFEEFDFVKKIKNYNMECISPKIGFMNTGKVRLRDYYMITDCLGDLDNDCRNSVVNEWGSFFPVYSETEDAIFFNRHCAECNHIKDAVNWRVSLSCDVNADGLAAVTSDILEEALFGKSCEIIFLPPEGMQKFVCVKNPVNKCNVTGEWREYDNVILKGCETVNAPVRDYSKGELVYANIFCVICNEVDYKSFQTCRKYEHHLKSPMYTSFSVLLDLDVVNTALKHGVLEDKKVNKKSYCETMEIKHPFKEECREVLCPNGYLRTPEGCRLYTTTWYVDGYILYLELDAIEGDDMIILKEFDHNQLLDYFGSIGLPTDLWVLYAATVHGTDNSEYVRGFSIVTGSNDFPLDARRTLETVELALKQNVLININNSSYVFNIRLADRVRSHFSEAVGSGEEDGSYTHLGSHNFFFSNFILNKLYFCNQVKLWPNEWLYINHSASVELRLGSNDRKVLNSLEYSKHMTESGANYIHICLEDFNPNPAKTNIANNNVTQLSLTIALSSMVALIHLFGSILCDSTQSS